VADIIFGQFVLFVEHLSVKKKKKAYNSSATDEIHFYHINVLKL